MSGMQIFVKFPPMAMTMTLDCESSDTILFIKEQILKKIQEYAPEKLDPTAKAADYHLGCCKVISR